MQNKNFLLYIIKFIGVFFILYFVTKAVIGLTVPGGYYSLFIAKYFDYPALLRSSLLNGTRAMVAIAGIDTYIPDPYHVRMVNGRGVHIVYACLGYGLLSFWIAFIFANNGSWVKKMQWMLGGCLVIWLINVTRISLVVISSNQHWKLPITMEQHTLFSIVVYAFIFLMIGLFNRAEGGRLKA